MVAMGGTFAVLALKTQTNAELKAADADLTWSQATVLAQDNSSLDTIKTFHTSVGGKPSGTSRSPRASRSAAEVGVELYRKLGPLLGKETDLGSRRARAQAGFEVAERQTRTAGRRHWRPSRAGAVMTVLGLFRCPIWNNVIPNSTVQNQIQVRRGVRSGGNEQPWELPGGHSPGG